MFASKTKTPAMLRQVLSKDQNLTFLQNASKQVITDYPNISMT